MFNRISLKLLVWFLFGLFGALVEATGPLNGLPILNGPVPVVPHFRGMKKRVGEFVHPGLWHTHDDLERIRDGVVQGQEPWKSAYEEFSADTFSQANYTMQGPASVICRGSCTNQTTFQNDARAAWQNSLMWYITKDQDHWVRATTILDAWGSNLTNVIGVDASLFIGIDGDMFVNAAEIMRWEGGWVEQGARPIGSSGFSNQLYWLFARQSIIIGQANYGMASIKGLLSFAIYLDDVTMYNYALYSYLNDPCAGIYGNYDTATGQSSEAGRDQPHTLTGLGWAAEAARVIQSQGFDAYSEGDHLLMKAGEYSAKYNLGHEVPYDRKFYRCEAVLVNGPWAAPSNIGRGIGQVRTWDILYYQYVVKQGRKAKWITQAKEKMDSLGGEGNPGKNGDHPGWGDLIWSYPGRGSFKNDDSRTIWGGGKIGPDGVGNINA